MLLYFTWDMNGKPEFMRECVLSLLMVSTDGALVNGITGIEPRRH